MLIATPAILCDLLSQLKLLPVIFGAAGTLCWIICSLPQSRPFSEVLRDVAARRGRSATPSSAPAARDASQRSREEVIGEALLEHMAEKNDFGEAVAQQLDTVGRRLAVHLAMAMYVFMVMATLLNAHYESLLPPGTCR